MQVKVTDKVKNFFVWFFLLTISVVFIFWGSVGLRLGGNQYIDANGEKIYAQEFNSFKRIYPEADLVQITLGIQELSRIGFSFSTQQLDRVITNLPIFQINGKFSNEQYQSYLSQNMTEIQAIRKGAYFNSLIQQMAFAMQQAIVVFPSTTENYYKLMDQKRNVSVLKVDQKKFLNEISIDDKELKNFYDNNKEYYIEPVMVKLEFIKLSYPDIVNQVKISNQDIEHYYSENAEQFSKPGKKKIAQIVVDMKKENAKVKLDAIQAELNKDNFGDLAQKYSDDSLTAKKQGDAGWFQSGDIGDPELEKAIVALNNVDEISPVVTYNDKWYIFRLLEQRIKEPLALEEVKIDIKTKLSEQKANTLYLDLKEQLERKSFEISDSLSIVADELGLKTAETDWLNKDGLAQVNAALNNTQSNTDSISKDIINNPKVLETAFSEDVLENRNNSSLIELNAETSIVIRIKDYKANRTKDYTEVKNELENVIKEIKAKQKAREYASSIWQDFIKDTSTINALEKIGQKSKYVEFHKPQNVSYLDTFWSGDSEFKQELSFAFDLPKPNKEYPLQAKLLSLENGNQSILAIDKVVLGEYSSATSEQKEQTVNQLKYYMFMRDNVNFFNRVSSNAKVKSYM